jgi:hypothetical protein
MITKGERYREILAVLARHGIGLVDDEFIKHEAGDQARAEHLRRACEELGTMFIKLGQALSTRGDLLPDAYRNELAKLQDEVVPESDRGNRLALRPAYLSRRFCSRSRALLAYAEHINTIRRGSHDSFPAVGRVLQ